MIELSTIEGSYPQDFTSSRTRFLAECARRKAELSQLTLPSVHSRESSTTLGQDTFSLDVALIGDTLAPKTIFYIAGTHGVEGFMGSAIQYNILKEINSHPKEYNLVFVHCLNPWGMKNLRRTNPENVDLNRNCLADTNAREGAPRGYNNIRDLVLPKCVQKFHPFQLKAHLTMKKFGPGATIQAIAGGQFVDPEGLFYGGKNLQPEISTLRSWIADNLHRTEELIAIDLHSGLGNFEEDVLLVDCQANSEEHQRLSAVFPHEKIQGTDPSQAGSYETKGSIASLFEPVLPDTKVSFFTHEFGTYPVLKVLHALVNENYEFHHSLESKNSTGESIGTKSSEQLKEIFCPSSRSWRERTVSRGVEIFRLAKRFFS